MNGWAYLADIVGSSRSANSETPAIATFESAPGPTFAITRDDIDPALMGFTSYDDPIAPAADITRREAIQCGAVTNVRNLICGTIGRLPLFAMDSNYRKLSRALLDQPERDVPRSVTITNTLDDMLFHGIAWWRVLERDQAGRGFPKRIVRLDPETVTVKSEYRGYVKVNGDPAGSRLEWVDERDMIRFDSPHDPLLSAGARAIRTCLRLDAAAASRAEDPIPQGILEYKDGIEVEWAGPMLEDETAEEYEARANAAKQAWQDSWKLARQGYATPLLPAFLSYNVVQSTAVDLQLAEARQQAVLEIARVAGVDGAFVGSIAPGSSNTYSNQQEKRRDLIEFVLADYIVAVQDRLSMDDVSPHGTLIRFDSNGFLRSNEKERMETYQLALDVGAYGIEEVQRREELPPYRKPANAPAAPVVPLRAVPKEEPLAAEATTGPTFADETDAAGFSYDSSDAGATFEVNHDERTITGLAVPYGVPARYNGRRYVFSRGSLRWADPSRVKLLVGHDWSQAVGRAVEFEETDLGLMAKFKVARGPEGDRVLANAEDKVWDGLSIGAGPEAPGQYREVNGIKYAVAVPLAEVTITPRPSFPDARISGVAAEADEKGFTMPETGTDTTSPPDNAPAPTFSLDASPIADAIRAGFESLSAPMVVSATNRPTPMQVNERGPYHFDGSTFRSGGQFDFSGDLRAYSQGDNGARDRVLGFLAEQWGDLDGAKFDIATDDANELNPSIQRPDMYVDQRAYEYPLWNAVRKESLNEITPIVLPKFNSSSGLVAAHVEGTEPTPGAFTTTGQTITPGAVSGKVEITRELWDQGGNPRVSNLIWGQMLKRWFEALEAKVVSTLDAESPTGITLPTAATDTDLADEVTAAFTALQFIRGGFSMDTFAAQIDLYKALALATDDDGRRLYPMLGPANANGTAAPRIRSLNVDGVQTFPSWALAATGTTAASSYLFDRDAVWGAASAPNRLEFNFGATVQTTNIPQVAYVTMAIWGYSVVAVTDLAGVREVIYDPAA